MDISQKMRNSGNLYQTNVNVDELLKELELDIPSDIAKENYTLLLIVKESIDRCKMCKKQKEKILSCNVDTIEYNKNTSELYTAVRPCPYAKEVYKRERYQALLNNLLVGKRFRNRTFNNFILRFGTKDAYDFCKNWCKTFTPNVNGIYITGKYNGCGKTHLAVAILLELLKKGIAGAFIVVPNFLNDLQNAFGDAKEFTKIFNTYKGAAVLVMDDINAIRLDKCGKASQWSAEQIFMLINYRYEWSLPTIITATCNFKELQQILDKRIVSRIVEMTDYVKDTATDYRLEKLRGDFVG